MIIENKWNGCQYKVMQINPDTIVLKRLSDEKVFEISKSEYAFSYKPSIKKS